ncbi:Not available [Clostridium perfringens]|nr:Not available [Clostridium perfringens]
MEDSPREDRCNFKLNIIRKEGSYFLD